MKNVKAQTKFPTLIIFGLGLIMFLLASPIIAAAIEEGLGTGVGTATGFVMKLFLWVVALVLIAVFFNILTRGGGFFG